MKRLLLAGVACVALGASAQAQTVFNWSGAYIGLHAGANWSNNFLTSDEEDILNDGLGRADQGVRGFAGGMLGGFNVQRGSLVIGAEFDIGFMSGRRTINPLAGSATRSLETSMRWNARARARFGYAWDNIMPFVGAGVVFADTRQRAVSGAFTDELTVRRFGVTLGAGLDYAILPEFIIRAEYLFDLFPGTGFGAENSYGDYFSTQMRAHTLRAALIWRPGANRGQLPADRPAVFDWSGVYVGAFAGFHASRDRISTDEDTFNNVAGRIANLGMNGMTGGLIAGINAQMGAWVFGGEFDLGFLTGRGRVGPNSTSDQVETRLGFSAHARARVGYAFGNVLPFVAAGMAFQRTHQRGVGDFTNPNAEDTLALNRIGLTLGAGIDYVISPNVFLRGEYLYDVFASAPFGLADQAVQEDAFAGNLTSHIFRVAVIWRPTGSAMAEPMQATRRWGGFYAGVFAGGHFGTDSVASDEDFPFGFDGAEGRNGVGGFSGGGLFGFNAQMGMWVAGAEIDIGFMTGRGSYGPNVTSDFVETRMRWNGHARGRLGYAMGDFLPFVAAGVAVTDTRLRASVAPDTDTFSVRRVGLSLGGGVDYMVMPNLILRGEYLFDTYARAAVSSFNAISDNYYPQLQTHTVRAAAIWRFN